VAIRHEAKNIISSFLCGGISLIMDAESVDTKPCLGGARPLEVGQSHCGGTTA